MEFTKYLKMLEKLRSKGVAVKFTNLCEGKEEEERHKHITVVLEKGFPKGVYIPFTQIKNLVEFWKEIKDEILGKDKKG